MPRGRGNRYRRILEITRTSDSHGVDWTVLISSLVDTAMIPLLPPCPQWRIPRDLYYV